MQSIKQENEDIDCMVELMNTCLELQSEKDGIDRPLIDEFDKMKRLGQFSKDIHSLPVEIENILRKIAELSGESLDFVACLAIKMFLEKERGQVSY